MLICGSVASTAVIWIGVFQATNYSIVARQGVALIREIIVIIRLIIFKVLRVFGELALGSPDS